MTYIWWLPTVTAFSPLTSQVWSHFDGDKCPGQAMGVRVRLDNGLSGFIPTKFLSDKKVNNPEERVQVI